MDSQLSLSIIEIIVLMLGAITVGITIHFFITSRRSLNASSPAVITKVHKDLEDWKLRYFNEIEKRDKEHAEMKHKLQDAEENSHIYSIEAEETRKENKKLQAELGIIKNTTSTSSPGKPGYMDQLYEAQNSLKEYNEKINRLISQIDIVKETEEKQQEILKNNEELANQVDDLKMMLSQKEKEVSNIQQKQEITREMNSMIDSAYSEFNVLQDKIHRLENQVGASTRINIDYEDLKEEHYKTVRDLEEQRLKYNAAFSENQELQATLHETEDKLREANFQRQQLQKKVAYLEDLNNDMQDVADANKKLEGQIKRIGELESKLNMIAEERNELVRKQMNA
jgi:chromosome segregation ATPase